MPAGAVQPLKLGQQEAGVDQQALARAGEAGAHARACAPRHHLLQGSKGGAAQLRRQRGVHLRVVGQDGVRSVAVGVRLRAGGAGCMRPRCADCRPRHAGWILVATPPTDHTPVTAPPHATQARTSKQMAAFSASGVNSFL